MFLCVDYGMVLCCGSASCFVSDHKKELIKGLQCAVGSPASIKLASFSGDCVNFQKLRL